MECILLPVFIAARDKARHEKAMHSQHRPQVRTTDRAGFLHETPQAGQGLRQAGERSCLPTAARTRARQGYGGKVFVAILSQTGGWGSAHERCLYRREEQGILLRVRREKTDVLYPRGV
jgi:hypothetical protein